MEHWGAMSFRADQSGEEREEVTHERKKGMGFYCLPGSKARREVFV